MLKLQRDPTASAPTATRERRRFRRSSLNERIRINADGITPAAELIDGSAGGLFLRVEGVRRPEAGEQLEVAFEPVGAGGTARTDERRRARVVRCLSHKGSHYVALHFAMPDPLRLQAGLG